MSYSYDRTASAQRIATFNITKEEVRLDVDLDPEKVSWTPEGKVLMVGKATFLLPHSKYKSEPYELEVAEDGTVLRCACPDPMQKHLIYIAATARKRELAELISDEKTRGGLVKPAAPEPERFWGAAQAPFVNMEDAQLNKVIQALVSGENLWMDGEVSKAQMPARMRQLREQYRRMPPAQQSKMYQEYINGATERY
jgi:hypothetical protein